MAEETQNERLRKATSSGRAEREQAQREAAQREAQRAARRPSVRLRDALTGRKK